VYYFTKVLKMPEPMTDDQVIQKLRETRDRIINTRLDLLENPKPNYNIDGQQIDWADYLDSLNKALDAVEKQIGKYGELFEEESVWYV
jgi:hypothetical protein